MFILFLLFIIVAVELIFSLYIFFFFLKGHIPPPPNLKKAISTNWKVSHQEEIDALDGGLEMFEEEAGRTVTTSPITKRIEYDDDDDDDDDNNNNDGGQKEKDK
jgi:hypothetical protein